MRETINGKKPQEGFTEDPPSSQGIARHRKDIADEKRRRTTSMDRQIKGDRREKRPLVFVQGAAFARYRVSMRRDRNENE